MSSPTALVLSGGGARAAYQAGVLVALGEIAPTLTLPIVTGVSAGAINALYLAQHPGPLPEAAAGLRAQWERITPARVYRARIGSLIAGVVRGFFDSLLRRERSTPAVHGLLEMAPLRRFLGEAVDLAGVRRNITAGRLRALGLSATSYGDGCTVTFIEGGDAVAPWTRAQRYGARAHMTLDHVLASAAIPIVFPAVRLPDGGFYGDGSVRQTAPLAPAIHLGARRIIAIGMRAARPVPGVARTDYPSSAEVLGLVLHSIFLDALDADIERLDRINDLLNRLPERHDALRPIGLLLLRPSRNLSEMARGYPFAVPGAVRWVMRAMGGGRREGADLLSYLLFAPPFTTDLMDLGYQDTLGRRAEVETFLAGDAAGTA
jgi:NTE family protein